MPAKNIKVVALEPPVADEPAAEAPTEAQGMDEVINNIETENTSLDETTAEVPLMIEESLPCESETKGPKAKAKAKAKATRKPKAVKEVTIEEPPAPAPTPEPAQEVKAEPVVDACQRTVCPDCGKTVSAKTLKYSHKANCKASKTQQPESAVAQPTPFDNSTSPQDDLLNRMAYIRQARMQRKMEQYSRLTSQIA